MHQCFFYFHTGLIHRTKIVLANSAKWTNPIFWKIFKCCTWLYAILWVANSWVIHPTADITYVFLHSHIVLIVICCKYTHYTSNDKAKRVKVLLIYNNYNSVCYLWETLLCKKLLCVPWVLWEYSSPTDCTDQHRWLVALVVAWVRQDAIPSYICVNPCYLWETLLYKKVLRRSVKSVGENHSEKVLCRSVKSVGENRSKKAAWVWQGCHTLLQLVLFNEHGGIGGDALHTTGEAELLCSCCLD